MRQTYRARRKAIGPRERELANIAAQNFVISHKRFQNAPRVALYSAFDGETDTSLIAEVAQAAGKLVLYPRMGKGYRLDFVEAKTWSTSPNGFARPSGVPHTLGPLDVLMVPGIAFDRRGHRLGFGHGYYDRVLAVESAWYLGLCYECQVADAIPEENWDRPVSALVTEAGLTEIDRPEK